MQEKIVSREDRVVVKQIIIKGLVITIIDSENRTKQFHFFDSKEAAEFISKVISLKR